MDYYLIINGFLILPGISWLLLLQYFVTWYPYSDWLVRIRLSYS